MRRDGHAELRKGQFPAASVLAHDVSGKFARPRARLLHVVVAVGAQLGQLEQRRDGAEGAGELVLRDVVVPTLVEETEDRLDLLLRLRRDERRQGGAEVVEGESLVGCRVGRRGLVVRLRVQDVVEAEHEVLDFAQHRQLRVRRRPDELDRRDVGLAAGGVVTAAVLLVRQRLLPASEAGCVARGGTDADGGKPQLELRAGDCFLVVRQEPELRVQLQKLIAGERGGVLQFAQLAGVEARRECGPHGR
mmetsp:Transcript_19071/g.59209  ORF Transcript_19071/g.59209 Transcript_19071/m.59209 type:complete len:248 (+) Transcript_19071:1624-2367(+)